MPASVKNHSIETPPQIAGYEVLNKLGQGGTSSVWKARQVSLGRMVVIKVLSEHLVHDPDDIQLFKREAMIAAGLKHPGIVQVHDFGRYQSGYYFIMEYISGYSVGDWLRRKGKLDEVNALIIAHCVGDALQHSWEQATVIHCDIKPDNIMVDGDGTIKVTDLGLAQMVSSMTPATSADQEIYLMGTPNYMSPEQARGEKNLDCRTDIYALGATLHHILSGRLPFGTGDPQTIIARQLHEVLPNPCTLNPLISAGCGQLIMKMLAKNVTERYQNWPETLAEIVRLEKEALRAQARATSPSAGGVERSSLTIPLQVFDEQAVSGTAAPASSAPAARGRACPHCGRSIGTQAAFCQHCGKAIVAAASQPAGATQKRKIKLKAPPPSSEAVPPASAVLPKPSPLPKHSFGQLLWSALKTLLSLALLVLLSIYAYQKLVKGRDIMVPARVWFAKQAWPAWRQLPEQNAQWLKNKGGWLDNSRQWIADRLERRATPPQESSPEE